MPTRAVHDVDLQAAISGHLTQVQVHQPVFGEGSRRAIEGVGLTHERVADHDAAVDGVVGHAGEVIDEQVVLLEEVLLDDAVAISLASELAEGG
jgi:hypothetical protein